MTVAVNTPVASAWNLATPVVIDGTTQVLPVGSAVPQKGILVQALAANGAKVYIGPDNTVSPTTGIELAAGASILLPVTALTPIYVIGTTVGDRVHAAIV